MATKIITSSKSKTNYFWINVDVRRASECWPWKGQVDKDGYGYLGNHRAHRIAWEKTHKTRSDGKVIRHSCDHPSCCNPDHLIDGTNYDNVMDRVERDRSAKGQLNGRSVLTAAEAAKIFTSSGSYYKIAQEFGVSKWTVRDIKTGKTWQWMTKSYS